MRARRWFLERIVEPYVLTLDADSLEPLPLLGAQITCFTDTKVPILTQKALVGWTKDGERSLSSQTDVLLTYADVC